MLKEQIRQIVAANPDYAAVTPVIEKEILHHDIMDVMIRQGAMHRATYGILSGSSSVASSCRLRWWMTN